MSVETYSLTSTSKFFIAGLFTLRFFFAEELSLKKYFFSYFFLMSDPDFTFNKPIHCLLDYSDLFEDDNTTIKNNHRKSVDT